MKTNEDTIMSSEDSDPNNSFQLVETETADPEIKELYQEIQQILGIHYVPNFFKAQAKAPKALAGVWAIFRFLLDTNVYLPRSIKEMILVSISNMRQCDYCRAVHLVGCKKAGVGTDQLAALQNEIEAIEPETTREIVRFALKCADSPQSLGNEDYDRLRGLGVSEEELLELVAISALSVLLTTLADGLKVQVNKQVRDSLESIELKENCAVYKNIPSLPDAASGDSEASCQFDILPEERACGEVTAIYEDIKRNLGVPFVPNFFKCQSMDFHVLSGIWSGVRNILINGSIPRPIKEMILVAISNARGCQYCRDIHFAMCKALGVGQEQMNLLEMDLDSINPAVTREMIKFALKCAENPRSITTEDHDLLRQYGVSDAELLEILAMTALSVFLNTIADGIQIPEDDPVKIMLSNTQDAETPSSNG